MIVFNGIVILFIIFVILIILFFIFIFVLNLMFFNIICECFFDVKKVKLGFLIMLILVFNVYK